MRMVPQPTPKVLRALRRFGTTLGGRGVVLCWSGEGYEGYDTPMVMICTGRVYSVGAGQRGGLSLCQGSQQVLQCTVEPVEPVEHKCTCLLEVMQVLRVC